MKATEFRIGNWVEFKDKSPTFDYTTLTMSCFEGRYIESKFNPVPLTEQWLINLGFKKTIDNEFNPIHLKFNNYIHLYADNQDNYSEIYPFVYIDECSDEIRICDNLKYVHQLQNLYFLLTGEELIFKTKNQ